MLSALKITWPEKIMKEKSSKPQAASLTVSPRDDRISIERIYYGNKTIKKNRGRSRRDPATSKERHGT